MSYPFPVVSVAAMTLVVLSLVMNIQSPAGLVHAPGGDEPWCPWYVLEKTDKSVGAGGTGPSESKAKSAAIANCEKERENAFQVLLDFIKFKETVCKISNCEFHLNKVGFEDAECVVKQPCAIYFGYLETKWDCWAEDGTYSYKMTCTPPGVPKE